MAAAELRVLALCGSTRKAKHDTEDLPATFNLLRRILMKMIADGIVPSKEALHDLLFGSDQATDA